MGNKKKKIESVSNKSKGRTHADAMNDSQKIGTQERREELHESFSQLAAEKERALDLQDEASVLQFVNSITTKYSASQIHAVASEVVRLARSLPTQDISLDEIGPDHYRIEQFGVRHIPSSVFDLSEQVGASGVGLINVPLLYRSFDNLVSCISGRKRINSMRAAGEAQIPCRILEYTAIQPILHKNGITNLETDVLRSVFNYIVYSESIHTSAISDSAVLDYFHEVQALLGLGKNDFHKILKVLGLNRKSSKYNDLHRLWLIAANSIAYDLVKTNKVRIRIFKVDTNISVMHHHHDKAIKVRDEVERYVKDLRAKDDSGEEVEKAFELKGYDDRKIQEIIHRADQPRISDAQYEARKYRAPRKNFRVVDYKINIQSFSLNLEDRSHNSVRQVIDTLFCLESLCRDLRKYAGQLTEEVRSQVKPFPSALKPQPINYDSIEYHDFIKSRSLWDFADLQAINRYLGSTDFHLLDENEAKLLPEKKLKIILQKLRLRDEELQTLRKAEQVKAANTADDEILKNAAPDLIEKSKAGAKPKVNTGPQKKRGSSLKKSKKK